MDLTYALWVTSIIFWIFSTMIEANTLAHDKPPPLRSKNHTDAPPKQSSDHPSSQKSKKSSSSSSSLSSSSKRSKSSRKKCCENGGICVMGVFCHCPKNFFGFRCEHEMRPCGPIEHKLWARVGCHLCRCYDSELLCLYRAYPGCDDKPFKEDIQVSDYEDDIHILPPDETTMDPFYADYYDSKNDYSHYYDDYDSSSSSSSNSSSPSSSSSASSSFSNYRSSSYNSVTLSNYSKATVLVLLSLCMKYCNIFLFENERIS